MNKHRQFWLSKELDGKIKVASKEDAKYMANTIMAEPIHVIEKSAYDELERQLCVAGDDWQELKKDYDELMYHYDKIRGCAEAHKKSADKLAEALDRVMKCGPGLNGCAECFNTIDKALKDYRGE